jgi:hypothetical protein
MMDFFSAQISVSTDIQLQNDFFALGDMLLYEPHAYHPISGPNSNSLVYTLLQEIGLSVPITMTTIDNSPAGMLNFNGVNQSFTGRGQYKNRPFVEECWWRRHESEGDRALRRRACPVRSLVTGPCWTAPLVSAGEQLFLL